MKRPTSSREIGWRGSLFVCGEAISMIVSKKSDSIESLYCHSGSVTMMKNVEKEDVRVAMRIEWEDHWHCRDQTWKTVASVISILAALVSAQLLLKNVFVTTIIGLLSFAASFFGALITIHHRNVERNKFSNIIRFEKFLGLVGDDLIPEDLARIPRGLLLKGENEFAKDDEPLRDQIFHVLCLVLNFRVSNTPLFILRIHIIFMLFSVLFVFGAWLGYGVK